MEPETQELPKRGPGRPPKVEEAPSGNVSISLEQFQLLMTTLITESRKPVIDPIKEKQRLRMKEHNKSMRKDALENLLNKFRNCNHMQLPGGAYTGCCCVAWGTQSDGVVRGPCQHCGTLFSPIREECIADEVWEMYKHLRRLPTHPSGNVSYTFQQA